MVLTAHTDSNETSTEITRHGSFFGRIDTQLLLLKACVRSLRFAEEHCQREVLLFVDDPVHSAFVVPSCKSHPSCRSIRSFRSWAERHRVVLMRVPNIIKGIPAADKLYALTLIQYRTLVMLDADMLVLRDMHELFAARQTIIAHHPYDLAQGKHCGIPLASRGVSALFAWQPNMTAFTDLLSAVRATGRHELKHYSEQLPLACYFHSHQRLQTLPCSYVYDTATPRYTLNKGGFRNCVAFGGVRRSACTAIAKHIEAKCLWRNTYSQAHAVHFKGKLKPWGLGVACTGKARLGRLLLTVPQNRSSSLSSVWESTDELSTAASPRTGTDDLDWSEVWNACISTRRRLQLTWADGKRISRKCCHINTALEAEWRALRNA